MNPYLAQVWVRKDDPSVKKAYGRQFEGKKAERLYAGIPELHRHFGFWSELGSHSSVSALKPHDAPNLVEVSAQTDNLEVINEILLHLLSNCLLMADLAKVYVQAPPEEPQAAGRQKRLALYQARLEQLNWVLKDHPIFGSPQ
jgi:hypothetical protein